jgi:hypothetical protein
VERILGAQVCVWGEGKGAPWWAWHRAYEFESLGNTNTEPVHLHGPSTAAALTASPWARAVVAVGGPRIAMTQDVVAGQQPVRSGMEQRSRSGGVMEGQGAQQGHGGPSVTVGIRAGRVKKLLIDQ